MDKVIRAIQGTNRVLTCGKKYSPNLTLDQTIQEKEKRRKGKGREEESRERGYIFSLDFPTIGPAVLGGSRREVFPRAKSFQ